MKSKKIKQLYQLIDKVNTMQKDKFWGIWFLVLLVIVFGLSPDFIAAIKWW